MACIMLIINLMLYIIAVLHDAAARGQRLRETDLLTMSHFRAYSLLRNRFWTGVARAKLE